MPLKEKRVLNLRISGTPPHECALQFLLLWRPNLATGKAINANEPLIEPLSESAPIVDRPYPKVEESIVAERVLEMQSIQRIESEGWISLMDFRPKSGDQPPDSVRFHSGEERPIRRHKQLLIEVAEFLIRMELLTEDRMPIGKGRVKYLVNSVQEHIDGSNFRDQHLLSNGLHLETKDPAPQTTNSARFLLEHLGVDPGSIMVRLA